MRFGIMSIKSFIKPKKAILAKIPDYENLISDDFYLIDVDGHSYNKSEMTARKRHYMSKIEDFQMTSISQKNKAYHLQAR